MKAWTASAEKNRAAVDDDIKTRRQYSKSLLGRVYIRTDSTVGGECYFLKGGKEKKSKKLTRAWDRDRGATSATDLTC